MSDEPLVTLDSLPDLGVDDYSVGDASCLVMQFDIGLASRPMPFELEPASVVDEVAPSPMMQINLHVASSIPMPLNICWPPISIEYVTDNGVIVVDENGQPVYHIVEAGGD